VRYHGFMVRTGLVLATFLTSAAAVAAFDQGLDPQSLADAIQIGGSRTDDTRARFHVPYHVEVMQPPVDFVEVVTPFRRIVLDAESRARAGERLYGQREAIATLGDNPSRVDLLADLTFHPLNNYLGVPEYTVTLLTPAGMTIRPMTIARMPRFGPRVSGTLPYPYVAGGSAPNGQAPSGGLVVAVFDGRALDPRGTYVMSIGESGKEVAKAPVDFGRLR
jgi:hypothetical protein